MEEVPIIKSVPNLISYLHDFFQNLSQSLAICFELFSFGDIFNSEIADERDPPVRRRAPRAGPHGSAPLPRGCHTPRRRRGLKPLSGQRAARPDSRPCSRRPPSDSVAPRPTASPIAPSPGPPPCHPDRRRAAATASLTARRAQRRRLHAGEPSFPAVSRAPVPCRRRLAEQRHHRDAPPPRVFSPVALRLDFIFSEYIQFFVNSKICVGFI
jgi:hypothetical protein